MLSGALARRLVAPVATAFACGLAVTQTSRMCGSSSADESMYGDKHVQITASFDDVKDIRLRPLPLSDGADAFAASELWREKPCVMVVMRRPG